MQRVGELLGAFFQNLERQMEDRTERPVNILALAESQPERELLWHLQKYVAPETRIEPQAPIDLGYCVYRLDCRLTLPNGRRVGLECDGHDFHHDTARDHLRDCRIMKARGADVIFRIAARDIHWAVEQVIFTIDYREPILSERGRVSIRTLAHSWPPELGYDEMTGDVLVYVHTPDEAIDMLSFRSTLRRHQESHGLLPREVD